MLGLVVLLTLAVVFVASYLQEARSIAAWIGLSCVLALVLAGGWLALRTSRPLGRVRLVDVLASTSAALATLFLTRDLGVPGLVAASLVAIALGVAMVGDGPLDRISSTAGYSGGFVGLIAPTVTLPVYWVLLAGVLSGVLWGLIAPAVLPGTGGRMGTTAFLASSAVYLLADLLGDRRSAPLIPPVDGLAHWAVVPVGCLATVVTWLLMYRLGWSLPMASGLTSLVVCGGLAMWAPVGLQVVLGAAWYGGTAVGRTDASRLPNAAWIALAGLAYGGLMLRFQGPLEGHVGVVGAMGLMAVLGVMALRRGLQAAASRLPRQPRVA